MIPVRAATVALLLAALGLLGACAGGEGTGPRPLTQEEAERLGVVRFRNYDLGVRTLDATVPATPDAPAVRLTGWADLATHSGVAVAAEGPASVAVVTGMVAWAADDVARLGVHGAPAGAAPGDLPPLPVPADGWAVGPVTSDGSGLVEVVRLLQQLGADRPENASLLQQSDAAWLRSDDVDGTPVDVVVGPSPLGAGGAPTSLPVEARLRYWLDATGTALRVDLPSGAVVRLGAGSAGVALGDVAAALPAPASPPQAAQAAPAAPAARVEPAAPLETP